MTRVRLPLPPSPAEGPVFESIPARRAHVGAAGAVQRLLPHPKRRLVGAFCFVDHFGPTERGAVDLTVGPHPHIGLQTVTWLLSGKIRHRDSLGTDQVIEAGQVNWMTAGRGISHSEDGENSSGDVIHGVQLWVALPASHADVAPHFHHDAAPPRLRLDAAEVTLICGRLATHCSSVHTYSPLVSADIALSGVCALPVDPGFEHAVVWLDGTVRVDGQTVARDSLVYLGTGRSTLSLSGRGRVLLLGGAPLRQPVRMWWNFVGREPAALFGAGQQWNAHHPRFGAVVGARGGRIRAPRPPVETPSPQGHG